MGIPTILRHALEGHPFTRSELNLVAKSQLWTSLIGWHLSQLIVYCVPISLFLVLFIVFCFTIVPYYSLEVYLKNSQWLPSRFSTSIPYQVGNVLLDWGFWPLHLILTLSQTVFVACKCHTTLQVLVKHGLFPTLHGSLHKSAWLLLCIIWMVVWCDHSNIWSSSYIL